MTIQIKGLECCVVIGILEQERLTPQRLICDLEAEYPYRNGEFLDYAKLREQILWMLDQGRYGLLEEALEELSLALKKGFPMIETLHLALTKPTIFPDCMVCVTLGKSWSDTKL